MAQVEGTAASAAQEKSYIKILANAPSKPTKKATKSNAPAKTQAVPGAILRVKYHTENWIVQGDNDELDCGALEIDSCEYNLRDKTFVIKAISTPLTSSMRREQKTRSWRDTTLLKVAQDIAHDAGLDLFYEVPEEISLDEVEQWQQADAAFLRDLAEKYNVAVKVTNKKIILFDEHEYEQRPPVDSYDASELKFDSQGNMINPGGRIIDMKFTQDTSDTASAAFMTYKDPKSGLLVQYEFSPPGAPATGQRLTINDRPGDMRGDEYRNKQGGGSNA